MKHFIKEPKTGVRASLGRIRGVKLQYIAEIIPPAETAVEVFESVYISDEEEPKDYDISAHVRGFLKRASFKGLKSHLHYKVVISTVVNGKVICQVSEDIQDYQEGIPVKIMKLLCWDVEISTTS